jgi:hypothetical protein
MFRLASLLYMVIATTIAGSLFIAVLAFGYDTLVPIVIAVVVGAVIAIPATWWLTKQITAKIV